MSYPVAHELDERVVTKCLAAWLAVNSFITRSTKTVAAKQEVPVASMDAILEGHGITFKRHRSLWHAYEREVRKRANAKLGRVERANMPPYRHTDERDRDEILDLFVCGMPRKEIAAEVGFSYELVAKVIREAKRAGRVAA